MWNSSHVGGSNDNPSGSRGRVSKSLRSHSWDTLQVGSPPMWRRLRAMRSQFSLSEDVSDPSVFDR